MQANKKMTNDIQRFSDSELRAQILREEDAKRKKILALRPGQWLHTEFSARGKEEDVEMMKLARSVVNGAYHTAATTSVYTPLAIWFVDEEMLADFLTRINEFEEASKLFNQMAANRGSERRTSVRHYLMPVDVSDERLALRMGQHVRGTLEELRAAIVGKDRKGFELAMDRARNMEMLAIGEQSEAIREAIEELKTLKKRMIGMLKSGHDQKLSFPKTDRAIGMFQSDDGQ